jgi:pSer/pThr/pTyr-binding forkhead associated (FHA) protein
VPDTPPGPPEDERDRTEQIDSFAQIHSLRDREAAAGIPGLAGYAVIVGSGPQRGLHWSLPEGSTAAGRDPQAPIFLDDISVSRSHAEFVVEGGHLWVRDKGSTNGTYVNGKRTEGAALEPGDEVIIGRFHLVVARGA